MPRILESFMHNFQYSVQKNKLEFYLKLIFYIAPIALLIWFALNFNINVPIGDHYDLIGLFEKIQQGTANFEDFFIQHNEHRIVFPKIIFTILAFTSNWNVKFETYLSILITIFSFYLIYKIAGVSQDYNKRKLLHLFNILTCFYIFSLSQMDNWIWGFQIAWFLMNAFVILAIFILTVPKNLPPKVRLLSSAFCCLIASFSMAHGLFSWLALIPSVLSVNGNAKQKRMRLLLWGILFILCCFIYSIGYNKPPTSPNVFLAFENPLTTIIFFLKLLGTPIINNHVAPIIGLIILSSFIFFNIYSITKYRSEFSQHAAPWFSMGWFAIIFSLITTVGRVGLGIDYAAAPKYTTVTILLIVSCLQMWRLLMSSQWLWWKKMLTKFSYFVAAISISLLLNSYTEIIPRWQMEGGVYRNSAKTCLEIIYYLDESLLQQPNLSNCLWFLYRHHLSVENLRDYSDSLDKLGFRDFPKDLKFMAKPTKIAGNIDLSSQTAQPLTLLKTASVPLSGWAMPIEYSQLPKVVLFSYGKNQSFFASAFVKVERPDVAEYSNFSRSSKIGWKADISLKCLPLGENIIKAWVYDRKNKQFVKLNNEVKVRVIEE